VKKALLYFLTAAVLGILINIIPLITVAQIEGRGEKLYWIHLLFPSSLGENLGRLEGQSDSKTSTLNNSFLQVATISFVVALAVYVFVRRRIPDRDYSRARFPPH
jgi:uncharacterized membrane-anchored protein